MRHGHRHINRTDIAALAKPVYICRQCEEWNGARFDPRAKKYLPPPTCSRCGTIAAFDYFQSEGEAKMWMRLLRRQEAGFIDQLERQIRIPLLTVEHATGKPVEWAAFVADFRWREAGKRVVGEYKPRDGMSYDAELKIRCCEAMGIPVTILSI